MRRLLNALADRLIARVGEARAPDFIIGGHDNPYLLRWFLTPWRRWNSRIATLLPNAYLHQFVRDDDDRALHDHPWAWCSVLLRGSYIEHTIAAGGIHQHQLRLAPSIKFSGPRRAHRVELQKLRGNPVPCWTLFVMGPRVRVWGFHCPKGWVDWRTFTDPDDVGKIGRGCGDQA